MSAVEQLYAADIVEIVLDLPFPPSINELWTVRSGKVKPKFEVVGKKVVVRRTKGKKLRRSDAYLLWLEHADMMVMASRQHPKRKISGPFSIDVELGEGSKADGDNCSFKAILDWCQSRDVIRNDKDCRAWAGRWTNHIPGTICRVTLRSLHEVGR